MKLMESFVNTGYVLEGSTPNGEDLGRGVGYICEAGDIKSEGQ